MATLSALMGAWLALFGLDGSVAERVDQRGIALHYTYDSLGRQVGTAIDDSAWFDPAGQLAPPLRVQQIDTEYEATGEPAEITCYGLGGTAVPSSRNFFQYDPWRNLVQEGQEHTGFDTGYIDYTWESSTTGNFLRLKKIQYPAIVSAFRRDVTFNYGSPGDVNAALSRVSSLSTYRHPDAAKYTYAGPSRRIGVEYRNGVKWSVAGTDGYPGLDRFGRIIDLDFKKSGVTAHRYQYGYDAAGNRTYARVTQKAYNGTPHVNDRSYLYEYDGLQRLVSAERGKLEFNNGVPFIQWDASTHPALREWTLDNLGNWPEVTEAVDLSGNGYQPGEKTFELEHTVNRANELTQILHDSDGAGPLPTASTEPVYDSAGNLIDDGTYVFQYDGLNRLVQVNEREVDPPAEPVEFDDDGRIVGGTLGKLVLRYKYDGLGRLIRKDTAMSPDDPRMRFEHYYYEGVRRIQEVFREPEGEYDGGGGGGSGQQSAMGGGGGSGTEGGSASALAESESSGDASAPLEGEGSGEGGFVDEVDPDAEPESPIYQFGPLEWAWSPASGIGQQASENGATDSLSSLPLTEGGESGTQGMNGGEGGQGLGGPATYEVWKEREYIWGTGDVDELACQFDANGYIWYALQDANLNVVGHTNHSGTVYRQYTYEPYGQVIATESFGNQPRLRLGFQGLFADRLSTDPTAPPLEVNPDGTPVRVLYHFRNRIYDPLHGRFTTADPNATAQPILEALAMNGEGLSPSSLMFDLDGHYVDGTNPYQFVSSNPITRSDPLGLFFADDTPNNSLLVTRDWDDIYESVAGNGRAYLGVQGAATFGAFWGGNVAVLPQGAMRATALSQGFSDFADFYAEQVIYLPVEGAFAGMGAFAQFAAVGSLGDDGFRFARVAHQFERHHPIAKFLGGKGWQRLVKLKPGVHQEFHRVLQEALVGRGFSREKLGWGTRQWLDYFRANIGAQRLAFDAILETSRTVDRRYGTDIVHWFWHNVMKGKFFSFM